MSIMTASDPFCGARAELPLIKKVDLSWGLTIQFQQGRKGRGMHSFAEPETRPCQEVVNPEGPKFYQLTRWGVRVEMSWFCTSQERAFSGF